jgi:predicted CoA-binding protein
MTDCWTGPDDVALQRILRGASQSSGHRPSRPGRATRCTRIWPTGDYDVYPVNPTITEIDGVRVYPSLADLPVVPDMVDVFRRFDDLPLVLADTLALRPRPKTLWLQLGLWHEQVARDAEAAGLQVVMDRCLKVDHALLL